MLDFGAPELLVILVIVILVFGPGRLAKTLGELGKGIGAFRDSLSSEENANSVSDANTTPK